MIEQIDLSDSLQEESVTGVQSRRVHVVHIVISTGLPVPCLNTRLNTEIDDLMWKSRLRDAFQKKNSKIWDIGPNFLDPLPP